MASKSSHNAPVTVREQRSHHTSSSERYRSDSSQPTLSTLSTDDIDYRKTSGRKKKSKRGSLRLTIIGAVTGGYLGHKIGGGDKLALMAGAAIGAYGLRELDRRT